MNIILVLNKVNIKHKFQLNSCLKGCKSGQVIFFCITIRRFTGRRGCTSIIYSDNGTHLKGATTLTNVDWKFIEKYNTARIIQWTLVRRVVLEPDQNHEEETDRQNAWKLLCDSRGNANYF